MGDRLLRSGTMGLLALLLSSAAQAQTLNGFDLRHSLVPATQIIAGGPAKDGIPAIDRPQFVAAAQASFLPPQDQVLAVHLENLARAYPLRILNWHEVVNDVLGSQPVVVTYCPLCGTGMVFDRRVGDKLLSFGVSGLLYNNDVLLYDRQTHSLWSQLLRQAITGPMRGQRLRDLPATHTRWDDWRQLHPDSRVMTPDTGVQRPYEQDPYAGYETSADVMFPMALRSAAFHPKERVLGLVVGSRAKAYAFVELAKTHGELTDDFAGGRWIIRFDAQAGRATVHNANGAQVPTVVGYWFAWYAFHPDTAVFRAEAKGHP